MRELTIAGRRISDDDPVYVIAEIGHNHGGDVRVAERLIKDAALCGVDAVKFQKRDNPRLYTDAVLEQPYESEHSYGPTYGAHRHALEFARDEFLRVARTAAVLGVRWFATAFDEASVEFLAAFNVPAYKVHSGGITDAPLLRAVSAQGKPVIVSTGGCELSDVDTAHDLLQHVPHAFLHCTAAYPLAPTDAHLRVIQTLRERYPDTVIGFSSHAPGIALTLAAVALGARIVEHHFTENRAAKGSDHAFSLEPKGMRTLVEDVEQVRIALGSCTKTCWPCEVGPIAKMRRRHTRDGWRIGAEA